MAMRFPSGEAQLRILSAAVLAPVALLVVWLGGPAYLLLVIVAAVIAFSEWTSMAGERPATTIFGALLIAAGLAAAGLGHAGNGVPLFLALVAFGLAAGARAPRIGWAALGLLAVGLPSFGLVLFRQQADGGLSAIIFLLIVVWSTDIAAYFGGRALGGPKLWARVSPGKTWSGALTGLLAAVIAASCFAAAAGLHTLTAAGLALVLSVAAQAGDLAESRVKRVCGAKDSGDIIPGHGGLFDRVDGLYGAAALALLLAVAGLGGGILAIGATS